MLKTLWMVSVFGFAMVANAEAQNQRDDGLLGATVNYLRASGRVDTTKTPVVFVDPRVLIRGGPGSVPGENDPLHDSASLVTMSQPGRSDHMSLSRARQCQLVAPPECLTNGAAVTIRLGQPIVSGDSASVELMIHYTGTPPSADSLAKLAPPQRGAANRSWRSAFHGRVHLNRNGGVWVAQRIEGIGRAG